ncbi:hypothetical protein [Halomonas sp. GD1P12]|uniref:hypothetical protein n=1 Tax=Halomonas sp. GD1P12 TaxID=2982691 RepID=UPI0021E3CD43|nr:hypothetical protein [Halomonas sp. GD1P12]UYF99356.1 hypothetical protein OCT39_14125 [Halomonas sp. GD1P12]
MATPAETSPRITVQHVTIEETQGPLSVDVARLGLESFNATCQQQTMTLDELLDVIRGANELGATDTTATFQLDEKAPSHTWSIKAIKPDATAPKDTDSQASAFQLTARQQALAEGVMVEVVGALAKQSTPGKVLSEAAINLANALRVGLDQLTTTSCSTRPTSCEQR